MTPEAKDRNRQIIRVNLIGIGINLVLSIFKLIIGYSVHSRVVVLDSINGFADILSSVIMIISAGAAGRSSSKNHPLGFGRVEYLTSLFITVLIMEEGVLNVTNLVIHSYTELRQAQLFTVDFSSNVISFYVVPDYSCKGWPAALQKFEQELADLFPEMQIDIHTAIDI